MEVIPNPSGFLSLWYFKQKREETTIRFILNVQRMNRLWPMVSSLHVFSALLGFGLGLYFRESEKKDTYVFCIPFYFYAFTVIQLSVSPGTSFSLEQPSPTVELSVGEYTGGIHNMYLHVLH